MVKKVERKGSYGRPVAAESLALDMSELSRFRRRCRTCANRVVNVVGSRDIVWTETCSFAS